jgi:sterol 14-demethylase
MLQRLMEFKFKDGSMMSDDELAGMMICALFAGQHTSSITTTFTALLLLDSAKKGAKHLDRVLAELAEVR